MSGRFTIEYRRGGYIVVDPEGAAISDALRSYDHAVFWRDAAQREADRRRKAGPRPCLCCGATFVSTGIHHRLCDPCRGTGLGLEMVG